jgi:predicted metal-binding membrane protein
LTAEVVAPGPVASRARLPIAIYAAIAAGWIFIGAAELTGTGKYAHHDALIEGDVSLWVGVPLFLLAWQLMLAAMMVPTTLPMMRHYAGVVARVRAPGAALAQFLGAYAVVWGVFGALAFAGDVSLHAFVDATPWLSAHEYVIAGGVLLLAGVVQFLPLTDRCLSQCRQPYSYLVQQWSRGITSPFRLGVGHAVFCVGCCWALMLVTFAAGVASLAWMAVLGTVMLYEKIGAHGQRLRVAVGALLLVWAALILVHPTWLPHALAGFE